MKTVLKILMMMWVAAEAAAQGIPMVKNYTAEDYQGQNFNFDIRTGADGVVYVANFEGLLYYDHVSWHTIYTPGYTRVVVIYPDSHDSIWVAGPNFVGKIRYRANGEPYLHRVGRANDFKGEVLEFMEKDGQILFAADNGTIYQTDGEKISVRKRFSLKGTIGVFDIIDFEAMLRGDDNYILTDTTQAVSLQNGQSVMVRRDKGLYVTGSDGRPLYDIGEDNGLCSDDIIWANYDGRGTFWGATENGLFSLALPSAFSFFTSNEGLKGEVLCITEFANKIYVGTNNGLFRLNDRTNERTFSRVADITHACWAMTTTVRGLTAATSNGICLISPAGGTSYLSTSTALSLLADGQELYSGEMDGVYLTQTETNSRRKVCGLERVSKIVKDSHGTIWLQSLLGEIWCKKAGDSQFRPYREVPSGASSEESVATLVRLGSEVEVISADADGAIPYPLFSHVDPSGVTWLTNAEGKAIYRWKNGRRLGDMDPLLHVIRGMKVRTVMTRDQEVWIGGNQGLTVINTAVEDPFLQHQPRLLIRSVTLDGDSVIWGGFGTMPDKLPPLASGDRDLHITFSLDYVAMVGETFYRYRLDDNQWSAWSRDQNVNFLNMSYGSHTFEVQGLDAFGRETDVTVFSFNISYPFYMRWYMNLLYLLLSGLLVYALMQLRMRKLERDKQRLEHIVEERTEEVRNAHKQLIKQEKLATVGKLTQGLIDRILNPLNYINNFSRLSEGLVRDITANIEDDKDRMTPDIYEDTREVLGMLEGNLKKVGEHGQNTTRTLKAMEEMLKDRTGGVVRTDLTQILKQDEEMVATYYAKEIAANHILTTFDYPSDPLFVMANPELLSKVFMSMFANGIYAVVKKTAQTVIQPEVSLKVTAGEIITLVFYDNGTGIEDTIIDKIFDPFFTTKTTGEASGIGLYLSHDIIQNCGGDITVRSVKNEYAEFTITLPAAPADPTNPNLPK